MDYKRRWVCLLLLSLSACKGTATTTAADPGQTFRKAADEAQKDQGSSTPSVLNPATPSAPADNELPLPQVRVSTTGKSYTLDQLRIRARDEGFESQVEFERVVEARLQARNSALNLLPHFGTATILNEASLSPLTMLKSVGDLVPFLLPSRWFHAKGAKFESMAEFYGWVLMRADSMHTVEGLCLAIAKDERAGVQLRRQWEDIRSIRDLIIEKEGAGLLQAGSSDDITSVMNAIAETLIVLGEQTAAEYAALAQASGFTDPDAIALITAIPPVDPEGVVLPDRQTLLSNAVSVSPEISQMGALVEAAVWARKERFFSWLDPSGDGSGDIGLGFGSYVALGRAHQAELAAKKEQVLSLVTETAATTLDSATAKILTHRLALRDAAVQTNRVDRLMRNLKLGIGFAMSDLVNALEDSTKNEISQVQAQFELQEELAKIQRLTLAGAYAGLAFVSPFR